MKEKKKARDEWIPETWRYNGAGYQKPKKGKGSYDRKDRKKEEEDYPRYR